MRATAPAGAPDSDGMWEATAALPEQVRYGAETAGAITPPPADGLTAVLALGMGGSGIGNDVLTAVAGPTMGLPVVVGKDYELPAFVGPSTLVFAASFSGNTEETLAAATEAIERGARLVAVTGGGALAALAADAGAPVVDVPRDIPHPRSAIGAMAVAPLIVLDRMGLLPGGAKAVADAVAQLEARRDQIGTDPVASVAGNVARRIGRTIPLVYGGGAIGRTAALRWKCQVNENPKSPAFAAAMPELCHNEVTGWGQMGDITRQLFTVIDLRHDHEHPQVGRRFGFVDEIMDEIVASVVEVRAAGSGPLAQLFDLVLIGDYVALMLAAAEGVDPGPIPVLIDLKAALAGP
ncbi:MAG: bifunctional phosphoglucose/phosphomannose isomerase [Acidimicrobiales bacterium]